MNETVKNILFVLLGIVVAVGIFCLVVAIGCAVNGIGFGDQIVEWFGTVKETVEELPTEETVATIKSLIMG